MNNDPSATAVTDATAAVGDGMNAPSRQPEPALPGAPVASRAWLLATAAMALLGLLAALLLWQKLSNIQEQLARQSADAGAQSTEARALARQAQELTRETAARLAVAETRLSEVALQRTQLEELMQSLSRSRDENLVVDIESSVRLAQQQAQLTGSVEPLLAALKSSEQRLMRAAQPRLAPLQRALARDVDRIKVGIVSDTPTLLVKLDELARLADELPVANAMVAVPAPGAVKKALPEPAGAWWQGAWLALRQEARNLLRVSRIEHPEAALLTPEQSFFLRENFKLRILNARLGLLAHQLESARADLAAAGAALGRYFDQSARKTQLAGGLLLQVQGQMKTLQLPRVDDTLAALATAAAGR